MTSFLRFVVSGGSGRRCELLVTATSSRFRGVIHHPLRVITVSNQSRSPESPGTGDARIRILPVPCRSVDNRRPGARVPRRPAGRRLTGQLVRARWSIAVAEVAIAIAAGLILPRVERHFGWHDGISYDVGAAESTLGAIAGGMITLTGFVLTAVTLIVQTVQSQSPRLLRVLDRTDNTPLLFGTFTATFTFALVALSQVRPDSVPDVSVTLALLLVLVSSGLFLRLLVTFRTTLTVGGLARRIGNRLREQIDIQYPARFDPALHPAAGPLPSVPLPSGPLPSVPLPSGPLPVEPEPSWLIRYDGESGIFQAFDEARVVRLAAATDTEIRFIPAIGDFLAADARLAEGTGTAPDAAKLIRLVHVGEVRTLEQDPAYGIRMLVDIAIRALSPAVNDPSSAVQSLDQLDDVLERLVGRSLGDGRLLDDGGRVLVRFPAPQWEAFLSLAVDEIILYGAGSIQVGRRLSALLDDLLASAPESRKRSVSDRAAQLRRAIRRALPDEEQATEAMQPDHQGIGSPRETFLGPAASPGR
jgi:uncharacterized membrane protein